MVVKTKPKTKTSVITTFKVVSTISGTFPSVADARSAMKKLPKARGISVTGPTKMANGGYKLRTTVLKSGLSSNEAKDMVQASKKAGMVSKVFKRQLNGTYVLVQ